MNHKIQSCTSVKTKFYYIPNSSYDSSNNRLWHILHIKSPKFRLEPSKYLSAIKKKTTKNELACQYLTYDEETVIKESVMVSAVAYRTSFSKSICLMVFFFNWQITHTQWILSPSIPLLWKDSFEIGYWNSMDGS